MFQVKDRVEKRHYIGDSIKGFYSNAGTVVAINGRWISVRHDPGKRKKGKPSSAPPTYDYLAEDLEHINPLLKFAAEL